MEEKLGALGTDLTIEDVTKYVVAKIMGKDDEYEIICVMGNNEDFYPMCTGLIPFARITASYSKKGVDRTLYMLNVKNLPVFTCEISHDEKIMTLEQATQLFFSTTDTWEMSTLDESEKDEDADEVSLEEGEYQYTIHAMDDDADFCTGKIKVFDDTTEDDIEAVLDFYFEELFEAFRPCLGDEYDPKQLLEDMTAYFGDEPKDIGHLSVFLAECICKDYGWQWETIEVSEILDSGIQPGMSVIFNTEDDTDLYPRNGETVTVLEVFDFRTAKELTLKRLEKGYRVRFDDGYETEVYQDELHVAKEATA